MRRLVLLALVLSPAAAPALAQAVDPPALRPQASWTTAAPPPDAAAAGEAIRYGLVLHVDPLALPRRIPVAAADDAGGALAVDPAAVETFPGRGDYPVNVTWTPARAGERVGRVAAAGVEHAARVRVEPAEALLALAAGNATADWTLPLRVAHAAAVREEAPTRWEARWTDGEAALAWNETGPSLPMDPQRSESDAAIRLRYGPGRYDLRLVVEGALVRGASPVLQVEAARAADPTGEAPVVAVVPDAPLTLALTSDTVNADGKLKRPGEVLTTRVRAADANGLASLARVTFEVLREGIAVNVTDSPLPADRWARASLDLEHRYAQSPLAPGDYVLRATAWNATGAAAAATRTFVIRPVKPDLADVTVPAGELLTADPTPVEGEARLASRAWERPRDVGGLVHVRVYRGSSQVAWEAAVANVTGLAPLVASLPVERHSSLGERGAVTLPIRVTVPAGANATYRVSVLWSANATDTPVTLASASLAAVAAPAIVRLEAEGAAVPGAPLALRYEIQPGLRYEGVTFALPNATVNVTDRAGRVELPVPAGLAAGSALRVEAVARAAGRPAVTRTLDLEVANAPPAARLVAALDGVPAPSVRILPGSARELRVTVAAWDANGDAPAVEALELRDWAGRVVAETSPIPREGGAEGVIDLPAALAGGRYAIVARLRDAAGLVAEASLPALVGGWAAVRVEATPVAVAESALRGSVTVENIGTVPLAALVVDLTGAGPLERDATVRLGATAAAEGAVLALPAPLAPGARVTIELEVPYAPSDPPGRHAGRVRVLAAPEAGGW